MPVITELLTELFNLFQMIVFLLVVLTGVLSVAVYVFMAVRWVVKRIGWL